jgi:hypothetical protein
MNEFQVSCITKSLPNGGHEHITHIGGPAGGGWQLTRESAIARIRGKSERFFTLDKTSGGKVYIAVVEEAGKAPYLRTYADGKWNDNLLAQPTCPISIRVIS